MHRMEKYYQIVILSIMIFIAGNVYAAQPPKQFMQAVIYAREGSKPQQSERYGTMSDFIKCLKNMDNAVSWEKTSNAWILHTKKKDSFTKKTTKISWEFAYDKKYSEIVVLSRVLADGVVTNDSLSVMENFKSCWEQPTWDTKNNILKALSQVKDIYNESGMSGVRTQVEECYRGANEYNRRSNIKMMQLERCLAFDLWGYLIDQGAQTSMHFPADPFFTDDSLRQRSANFLEYYSQEDFDALLPGLVGFIKQNL